MADNSFFNSLTSLFGWRTKASKKRNKDAPIEFVNVDLQGVDDQRITQALAQAKTVLPKQLSDKLETLFDFWLKDTTDTLQEIQERGKRINQIDFARLNDPFISRVLKLSASEATQIDVQDRIFSIESPNPRMNYRMYELLKQWGVSQNRTYSAIEEIVAFGDHFWAVSLDDKGVQKIKPLKQLQVTDKLEFSPIEAHEKLVRKEGFSTLMSKESLIRDMIEEFKLKDGEVNLAEMFDVKQFGYVIDKDFVVPPWSIIHFKLNNDSEFAPFGRSAILGALSPFKLTFSTMTLQSIARLLSFPITLYKVKVNEGTDPARQFEEVNNIREAYDNIGVTASGNNESYTVNTKIWMPADLLEVSVISPSVDIKFTDDIEMYQDRVAIATGIPKGYLVQEWGGFGNSGVSLVEQWKPFAREVFNYQTSFLQGLSDLFRLHFVISGEFDYRTPFTISMKFPGDEMSGDKLTARQDSLELANDVIEVVKTAIGVGEDEGLSPEIVRDILSKYSFLDPVDISKWTQKAQANKTAADLSGGSDFGEEGDDLDNDFAEEIGEGPETEESNLDDLASELPDIGESSKPNKKRLREKRIQELNKRYFSVNDDLYFKILTENNIDDFTRNRRHVHVSSSSEDGPFQEILERLSGDKITNKSKLQETVSLTEILKKSKEDNLPESGDTNLIIDEDTEEEDI